MSGPRLVAAVCLAQVLVTATDRVDAKVIYLTGVALTIAGHLACGLSGRS